MAGKEALARANRAKNDEFYTQLVDVEAELRHYRDQFRGKVVFCDCDDPYESNFFKYFAMNFNHLGLKKLITTCYTGSPITGSQLSLFDVAGMPADAEKNDAYRVEITEVPDVNNDGAIDLSDVEYLLKQGGNVLTLLSGGGDFRSPECVALLDEADIVVTNPPFSLFREYVAQLMEHGKQFLIIGNKNAITYQEIFRHMESNQMWLGYRSINSDIWLKVPDGERYERIVAGVKLKHIMACWYTNLDTTKRHEEFVMYKQYSPAEYPAYDNYDAIEVAKVADIPADYAGAIGVPITFLDKYNPDQFEILGLASGGDGFEARPTKRYVNARQLNPDGTESSGGKVNTGAALVVVNRPAKGFVYVADGVEGYLVRTYMRIIVRNRNPRKAPA